MIHHLMHEWLKDKSEAFVLTVAVCYLASIPLVCGGVWYVATHFGGVR